MTSEHVPPDRRWALFIGGLDAGGRPRPMAHADLVRLTEKWPTTAATPPGVADLLSTARALITLAWFHYESMVVAGMWSLLAVEAALRVRLDSEQQLVKLIGRAQQEGLITDKWATQLQAARHLRNDLAHARQQDAWTLGMAAPVLATAHEVIAVLYPD
ncbi:hypothetical protein E4P41_14395 [Geodermatophilus sp. DF01-2]|uniref:hypothetical protein n=1 Tax=Geodermatophilus sp. DF01-2 TaxID=2559610 RepID=UPI001074284E|nr:hypothetical protein [Geodermatophilus sp. DF01_2]TFV57419.1 hypothetical protein E4P41_14395 [Geodermatophilus sp. DF01_2]